MKTIYIRELEEYSKDNILQLMKNDSFNKLLENEIIKKDENTFKFNFVGIIIVDNYIINCYPKYIPNEDNIKQDFKQIIRVIKKYKKLNDEFLVENENLKDTSFNLLSMMIFFIEDYYENGIYTKIQNIREINGNGEIDWNKTISKIDPIIKDNKPYYGELYTKYKISDVYDYFRLLHEYIITQCCKSLDEVGLIELFDITPIELSDKDLSDFGEKQFILKKLENELNVEFNSHKQKILKTMHSFISQINSFSNEDFLTIYGTSTYNVIWEELCKKIFKNKLNNKLDNLDLKLNEKYNPKSALIDIIEKPIWNYKGEIPKLAKKTFIPDIVTLYKNYFIILDAKYYKLNFSENILSGQPGLESIVKQYLYELSYREFINLHDLKPKNAFLFPTYANEIENRGNVELKILKTWGLQNIQIIMLPASEINQLYLDNKNLSVDELKI